MKIVIKTAEDLNDLLENKYPEILRNLHYSCIDDLRTDPEDAILREQYVISFSAIHLIYYRKFLKDTDTLDQDVIMQGAYIANKAIENVLEEGPLARIYKDYLDEIAEAKEKKFAELYLPADTIPSKIMDPVKRNEVSKCLDKISKKYEKLRDSKRKSIPKYDPTGPRTSGFVKKVKDCYYHLDRKIFVDELVSKFHKVEATKQNITAFEDNLNKLFDVYAIKNQSEAFIYLRHMFVNIKRNINRLSIVCPQMYCFCGTGEMTGKTALCNSIWRVAANKRNTEDEYANSSTMQNLRFEQFLDRFGTTDIYSYPIIHVDEKSYFERNQEEKLKTIISSSTVNVERKGRDIETVENRSTIIVSLNDSADMIMHDNTKERRRAIIEFPEKDGLILKKMTSIELDDLVESIIVSAPSDYYYDVNESAKKATEHKGTDTMLEAMLGSLEFYESMKAKRALNAKQWNDIICPGKSNTTFLRLYMKRHPEYFTCISAHHGCLYFKPTDELGKIIEEGNKINDGVCSDDGAAAV